MPDLCLYRSGTREVLFSGHYLDELWLLIAAQAARVDLTGVDLRHVQFTSANLEGLQLPFADLRHADLSYANLRGTNLTGAKLAFCDLTGADLFDADLTAAVCRFACMDDCEVSGMRCPGVDFSRTSTEYVDFTLAIR